jgi:hypothetical protein
MFCPYAFGTVAIDVAVVAEPPRSVIEQKLTAGAPFRRRKKYRARVDLVIAWRDQVSGVLLLCQIFFVHEQAKREKNCDYNKGVQGTMGTRADCWWTGPHPAKIAKIN